MAYPVNSFVNDNSAFWSGHSRPLQAITLLAVLLTMALACNVSNAEPAATPPTEPLVKAIRADHRSPAFVARDRYRHPVQTLRFFGLTPSHKVVEIWPSGGWYAEILAPYLRAQGQYIGAGFAFSAKRTPQWRKNMQRRLNNRLAAKPALYDQVVWTELSVPEATQIAPEASMDMVLTFRNVHNWMKGDYAPKVFAAMYKALKPGGHLGLVEHRAKPGTSRADMIKSGYVTENHVIILANQAGFRLQASAEINANAKDDKDHPAGVWTLPPGLRLKERDRAKYLSIGESDRMTLLFQKPSQRNAP